ncbi:MAG: flavodoxin family protein [Christensenella sp.]|nr:flavodoxin family protein [Christensenella sp.]
MKLLLINSSARAGGNTARVMDLYEVAFSALARELGVEIETEQVNLSRLSPKTCLGCRACFDLGEEKCPLHDELLPLRDRLLTADGYVIASPVYVEDVNSVMKNWIDRMAFTSHRPALFGKTALLYTTCGIGSSNHALRTMQTAFGTWAMKTIIGGKYRLGAITEPEEIRRRYAKQISRSARRLVSSIQKKPFRPSLYSLIAFTVQQTYWRRNKAYFNTFDYAFWNSAGWLDNGRRYYDPAMARSLRASVARLLGKFVALFFG